MAFHKLQPSRFDKSLKDDTSGVPAGQALAGTETSCAVWKTISRWLPARNVDSDFWWNSTGPQLCALLFHTGYDINQQYEGLLFHYHVVVPRLGPRPMTPSSPGESAYRWKSFLQHDFKPLEYSWKWDTGKELSNGKMPRPDLRMAIEAISPFAGTGLDPLNHNATREILQELAFADPRTDLTWCHEISQAIFGSVNLDEANEHIEATNTAEIGSSSMFLAFQFLKGDPKSDSPVKAYFMPLRSKQWNGAKNDFNEKTMAAIRSIGQKGNQAWTALDDMLSFMSENDNGKQLSIPFMVSADCMISSDCRLKIYFRTPRASFDSVVDILTMGGRRTGFEKNLQELKDLWRMTFGLPVGFSTSEDLPLREHATSGMCYHFELQQANSLPDIKLYIPVKHYGKSDMKIAEGFVKFLRLYGRGKYAAGYITALKELAPLHQLESSSGIQSYISCALDKENLSVTSYFNPCIPMGN